MNTSETIKPFWWFTGDFHTRDEIQSKGMQIIQNVMNPVNGIMIGQRNRPDTAVLGKGQYLIRRQGPIRGGRMYVKINQWQYRSKP
jgi:hypothetical protein